MREKMRYWVWDNLANKYNNQWVQKYSLGPTRREVLKIVVPLLKKNKDLKILDIGCGTGQLIGDIIKEVNVKNYKGIDVSSNMIEIAKKNNKNLCFENISIEEFNTDEKFDIVICTHSFPYFPEKENILKKISSFCNKKAIIIIVNSSTNNLMDLIINFFLEFKTSKAEYLSIKKTKELLSISGFNVKDVKIIRERFYMPTIALFHGEKK